RHMAHGLQLYLVPLHDAAQTICAGKGSTKLVLSSLFELNLVHSPDYIPAPGIEYQKLAVPGAGPLLQNQQPVKPRTGTGGFKSVGDMAKEIIRELRKEGYCVHIGSPTSREMYGRLELAWLALIDETREKSSLLECTLFIITRKTTTEGKLGQIMCRVNRPVNKRMRPKDDERCNLFLSC
ncbi:hypothetical protein STEG23_014047, partial [Scotinomys teguina]